ncbi:Gfo/Idh/MocA family oxidoreductase [Streptomyces sp. A73]|uniref:Gfo/Idh/MocA family protein n=1 Tax=unclassified Streptomyces TaxID=2593676 RepID=UPI00161B61FB|nr:MULTISPECIES: Gfo/Idh/MocA family oxidoreductase [unclassified Streptomyces]MBQ0862620.1 Gfo/Idh/MocA family oxidoreductase [Streptomyces sp. RK75]MBQ1124601.1 Gfo/Idh/MocA family oxidoreductase [Streptomyces sp. B15]MBQ1160921.1 Gfo/Idh/MocA family oxidoreductase [Streptomyces sp. A73]
MTAPWTGPAIRVGLVGAGPWARTMHARMLAAGPETELTAVWARRPEAAAQVAVEHGAKTAACLDELFERCEAVAFAVPPAVQAQLAPRAARAGRALLLEKPLGPDLAAARAVADAVADSGVVSQLVLTKRYHPATRHFLARARGMTVTGARSCYLHGAFLGGDQATAWRLEHGALLDLGPHLLDLLDLAVGPVTAVHGTGDPRRWTELTCEHENGAVSQASLSGAVALPRARTRVELYGPEGELVHDTADLDHEECWPVLRREFATAVRSGSAGPVDAQRGLRLQQLLDQALR